MARKAKLGWSVLRIIGIVYSILGGVFAILGGVFLFTADEPDLYILGGVFSLLGGVFMILGGAFLVGEGIRKKRVDALVAGQKYIWGQVVDITPNYQVRVNGRNPAVFIVRHTDARGTDHIFRSHNVGFYRDERLIGKQVRIYIQDETYRRYYVDVEEILPNTVEH